MELEVHTRVVRHCRLYVAHTDAGQKVVLHSIPCARAHCIVSLPISKSDLKMDGNACFVMGATTHDSCKTKRGSIQKKEKRGNIFFDVSLRPVLFFCYNKEEPILNVTPQKKRNNIYCSFFLEHASAKYYALIVRSGHKKDHVAVSFYLFYLK